MYICVYAFLCVRICVVCVSELLLCLHAVVCVYVAFFFFLLNVGVCVCFDVLLNNDVCVHVLLLYFADLCCFFYFPSVCFFSIR